MPSFLVRSHSAPEGYARRDGPLPRTRDESYVPWALTIGGKEEVVYAKVGEHRSWNHGRPLQKYDTAASQRRRREATSILGRIALDQPSFSASGVNQVTTGIRDYLQRQHAADSGKATAELHKLTRYFYSDGSFGRFGGRSQSPNAASFWWTILDKLANGSLQQVLNIHDQVGRKLLISLGGPEKARWEDLEGKVRPDSLFLERGRIALQHDQVLSTQAGIVPEGTGHVGAVDQAHYRAVEVNARDFAVKNAYYNDLDDRNYLFGAGPSGTTGTLLQSAMAFGQLGGELLKEYVFAIIGYLVGGGMHSLHESLTIASRVGLPYTASSLLDALPGKFKRSAEFDRWSTDYHDIVVLGATAWLHNVHGGADHQTAPRH